MIKNIAFTFNGNKVRRSWFRTDVIDDIKIIRLMRMLQKINDIDAANTLIRSILPEKSYSTSAEKCILYTHGKPKAKEAECIYDKERKVFVRGKYDNEIEL